MKVHPITLPAFGAVIAGQGGIFAAIMRGPTTDGIEQPPFALLVSDAAAGECMAEWGQYGKEIEGCASRSDGKANTEAMAAADCPAALKVKALTIDSHSDWYLPSLGELNSAAANVPEQFNTDNYYWTSTQHSRDYAFVQDFASGLSGWYLKGGERRVSAFRRMPLDLLNT
jgi:hypothetical protein